MGVVVGIALIWFIIEMLVWYLVAQFISGWLVFVWFVVAAVIGLGFIKKSATALNPMAQQMQQLKNGVIPNPANTPPETTVTRSIAFGIAGLLLFLPGLLSDIGALLLLLPAIQNALTKKAKTYAMNNQEKMMAMMANQMSGQSPFGRMGGQNPFGGTTIDGQAKTIHKSANDD